MARDLHDDFYQRLRKRLRRWSRSREGRTSEVTEYVLLAPDLFHLLVRLSFDPAVSIADKGKVGAALAYFLSPIDLLPEALVGPLGYLDDVAIAILVVHNVLERAGPVVVNRHWAGDADLLDATRRFMDRADELLGSGLWARIQGVVDRATPPDEAAVAPVEARPAKRAAKKPAAKKGSATKSTPRKRTAKKAAKKRVAKKRPS